MNIERKDIWQVERQLKKEGVFVSRTVGFYNSAERAVNAIRRRVEGEITAAISRTTIGGANSELDLGLCKIQLTSAFTIARQSVEVDNYPPETQPEGECAYSEDPEEFHIAEDLGDVRRDNRPLTAEEQQEMDIIREPGPSGR